MQDPRADTEWNDALRKHGIIPELKEEDVVKMVDETIAEKTRDKNLEEMTLDELHENEDDYDDERLLESIRRQRMAEILARQEREKYGDVREISAVDYVEQVNEAGKGVWVVLHLYKTGIPLCDLLNQHLRQLATKFPATKFLKSISNTCIPNYPDKNLPTIFVYRDGEMKLQLAGPLAFGGMQLTVPDLEWMLSKTDCVKTTMKSDPRGVNIKNTGGFSILSRSSRQARDSESDDD